MRQRSGALSAAPSTGTHSAAQYNRLELRSGALALAVVICGQRRNASRTNSMLQQSPAETWLRLRQSSVADVKLFSCTDEPLQDVRVPFSGQWVFPSISQFARLHVCLLRVEGAHPGVHDAFLRLRPDALVLGPLPDPLLPDPLAFYGKYYHKSIGFANLTRDDVDCGICEQHCECLQRKFGQNLFRFSRQDCAIVTDKVFLFGRKRLFAMLAVLHNFSEPSPSHPMRSPRTLPGLCVDVGRMVEVGFSRLIEMEQMPVRPLRFRTVLDNNLQRNTPGWASVACMMTWGAEPVSCRSPCGNASSWLAARGSATYPTLKGPHNAGCNSVSRNWYPAW